MFLKLCRWRWWTAKVEQPSCAQWFSTLRIRSICLAAWNADFQAPLHNVCDLCIWSKTRNDIMKREPDHILKYTLCYWLSVNECEDLAQTHWKGKIFSWTHVDLATWFFKVYFSDSNRPNSESQILLFQIVYKSMTLKTFFLHRTYFCLQPYFSQKVSTDS